MSSSDTRTTDHEETTIKEVPSLPGSFKTVDQLSEETDKSSSSNQEVPLNVKVEACPSSRPTSSSTPSSSSSAPPSTTEKFHEGIFECNICLEMASEPVVTLCGHLFCWPCIHQWLESNVSLEHGATCPVCKASVSSEQVIPVYARGNPMKDPRQQSIPNRPAGQGKRTEQQESRRFFQNYPSHSATRLTRSGRTHQGHRVPSIEQQELFLSRIFFIIGVFVLISLLLY